LDAAIAAFREVIQLEHASATAYNCVGTAFFAQRKWEDATAAYLEATRLDPKSVAFRNNLGLALDA
jgi:Flp pilus assembly protein TadD